jgi:hypothetical protein
MSATRFFQTSYLSTQYTFIIYIIGKNMIHHLITKKRLIQLFVVLILVFIGFLSLNLHVFLSSTICSNSYLAAYIDKQELLKNTSEPRIIFVGDSGFVHSLDSEKIQDKFDLNPINAGILGAIGLRFIMESTKPYIQENDIIMIGVSLGHWITPNSFDSRRNNFLWQVLVMNPNDIQYLTSLRQVELVFQANYEALRERIEDNTLFGGQPECIEVGKGKARSEFNEYGDFIGHLSKGHYGRIFDDTVFESLDIDDITYEITNEFAHYVEEQGASIYYIPIAHAKAFYNVNMEISDAFMPTLRANLDFPVLGDFKDFTLPDNQFYDAAEHTTAEGREQYTRRLIELISPVLNTE